MDIKAQVVQEYLAGGTSYRQLSAKYGMSRDVINKWVMIHQGIHNLPLTKKQQQYSVCSMSNKYNKLNTEPHESAEALQQKRHCKRKKAL